MKIDNIKYKKNDLNEKLNDDNDHQLSQIYRLYYLKLKKLNEIK